jgi:hypothetical protein
MIFRLPHLGIARNAQPRHVLTQLRQRFLLQEPSEIVRTVGHQLTALEADEEVVVLFLDRSGMGLSCEVGKSRNGTPQRALVACQRGSCLEISCSGRA